MNYVSKFTRHFEWGPPEVSTLLIQGDLRVLLPFVLMY